MNALSKHFAHHLAGWALMGLSTLSLLGCGQGTGSTRTDTANNAEMANATGDTMASLDETASGGEFAALIRPVQQNRFQRAPGMGHFLGEAILPSAKAAGCWSERFTACDAGARSRTFDGCTVGNSSFTGNVSLTFSDSACAMSATGDSVTRSANFTLAGPDGGTYTVSSPNGGQTVTRLANGLAYAVHGLRRVATSSTQTTLFDISTDTTTDFSLTGTSRANRVLNGGTLVITNNLLAYTATLSATNVAWSNSCNCPVSGSLSGAFTGSKKGTVTLDLTGCGTATLTVDKVSESVTFDRCGSLPNP